MHVREQRSKPHSEQSLFTDDTPSYSMRKAFSDIFSVKSGFPKLLVPAILYTLQNNLQFVAASNLDAATFQVTYQGKILTTALFSVLLLQKRLTPEKWLSLLILTIGVGCIQIPSGNSLPQSEGTYFLGIMAVAIACMCSGFAGVYFEKVLKGSQTSIWVRNIQLSVGCLAIAVVGTFAWDGVKIAQGGFFQGYNTSVVLTILIQAAGGLIVAMVIKYADNILKGFATSISIILSTVASVFMFNFVVTLYFSIGAVLVCFATYLYGRPESVRSEVADEEKRNEQVPMLTVEDFDEKQLEHERRHSTDSIDSSTRYSSPPSSRESQERQRSGNVSPSMLQDGGFGGQNRKVIDEHGLAS